MSEHLHKITVKRVQTAEVEFTLPEGAGSMEIDAKLNEIYDSLVWLGKPYVFDHEVFDDGVSVSRYFRI